MGFTRKIKSKNSDDVYDKAYYKYSSVYIDELTKLATIKFSIWKSKKDRDVVDRKPFKKALLTVKDNDFDLFFADSILLEKDKNYIKKLYEFAEQHYGDTSTVDPDKK